MSRIASLTRSAATIGAAAMLLTAAAAAPARASGSASGNSIIGVFSNPIRSGNVQGTSGAASFQNNGATAVVSGTGTNTLIWGSTDGQAQSAANSSSLTFTGASNLALNAVNPVQVGKISFNNGGSSIDTLIFGATLTFYFNTVSPETMLGFDTVFINTTTNNFSQPGLTASQLSGDADYVSICGNASNICSTSVEAFESTEVSGYQPFLADLNGIYQGDPSITLTSVVADPVSMGTGQIGTRTQFAVPEPASAALVLAGLIGGAAASRRRRSV